MLFLSVLQHPSMSALILSIMIGLYCYITENVKINSTKDKTCHKHGKMRQKLQTLFIPTTSTARSLTDTGRLRPLLGPFL